MGHGSVPESVKGEPATHLQWSRWQRAWAWTAVCSPTVRQSLEVQKYVQNARVNPMHVAVVDDEADITRLLAAYLPGHGFRVTELHSGAALLALLPQDPPALVLLDLGLPGEDGLAIARLLRETTRCGLLIVSGRGDAVDRVVGLEIGADDYITKPFDLRELAARIKAVARRLHPDFTLPLAPVAAQVPPHPHPPPLAQPSSADPDAWHFEGWTLDRAGRRLLAPQGDEVALTGGEFDLLCVLVQHAGRVLSRDFLLEATRGREAAPFDRTIDVQVGRLRRKLRDDAPEPRLIKAVRGAGYVLVSRAHAR
jgi:two-component system, OmpR family, response regulator